MIASNIGYNLLWQHSILSAQLKWICFTKLHPKFLILVFFSAETLTLGSWRDSNHYYFVTDHMLNTHQNVTNRKLKKKILCFCNVSHFKRPLHCNWNRKLKKWSKVHITGIFQSVKHHYCGFWERNFQFSHIVLTWCSGIHQAILNQLLFPGVKMIHYFGNYTSVMWIILRVW